MFLNLIDVLNFVGGYDENSRCVTEGERILRANLIVKCGILEENDHFVKLFALVLQTSCLSGKPHEVHGTLKKSDNRLEIETFNCSCTAGAGRACKHITAVLLMCQQHDVSLMEKIFATDTQCLWKALKPSINMMNQPVPLTDFCHVDKSKLKSLEITEDDRSFFREKLFKACPDSAVAQYFSQKLGKKIQSNKQSDI